MTSLAVVGGGPRALWALERLASEAARAGRELPQVDVYTPRGRLGASEHYDPALPEYLRLNVGSTAIDAGRCAERSDADLPSFDEWRRAGELGESADPFPPRALAGGYLNAMADRVTARFGGRLRIRDELVVGVSAAGPASAGRWQVRTDTGNRAVYLDVLLVTGHARDWLGGLGEGAIPALPIPAMVDAVPEMTSRVVIRGAALTAIDVVLALTEGRGGCFRDSDGVLVYHPSGREPRLTLVSRTGRLMLPKTQPLVLARRGMAPERASAVASARLAAGDWPGALVAVASLLTPDAPWSWVRAHGPETLERTPEDPRERLRADLAIACGRATPDARWALGQAWRVLYAELVAAQDRYAVEHLDGPPLGWADYAAWSGRLERLAFGPPPINAAKLLALLDANLVEVVAGDASQVATDVGAVALVDAVLPPPGLVGIEDQPWRGLVAAGAVSRPKVGRGIRVRADGGCVGADGHPTPGLWALGRVAEDTVIGHDTLIRPLHPGPDRWARSVLANSTDPRTGRETVTHG